MPEPLKNLYTRELFERLAGFIQEEYSDFDGDKFLNLIIDNEWEQRELKERMRHITHCLRKCLPEDYPSAIEILKPVSARFEPDFLYMFFPDFVEVYGLEDFQTSVSALEHFTAYSSSEFAVRPFIIRYGDDMMKQMNAWANHENYHVRRLASEGCRPRLPWAMALPKFKKDPAPVLPILEKLKNDPTEYVRRSVANNLNDIAKDHPETVIEIGKRWQGKTSETDWVVKHASRSLLKQGHPKALMLFGFSDVTKVAVENLSLDRPEIQLGEQLDFSFEVVNNSGKPVKLRVEYRVGYMKANGKRSPKMFMITENNFEAGARMMSRSQEFKDLSTRKHYPGEHELSVVVNGIEKAKVSFQLHKD